MKKLLWLALFFALPLGAQVTPGLTTPQIQTIVSNAASGSTVTFAAGTYSITAQLAMKCGVSLTGPVANPATAILVAASQGYTLFGWNGGCTTSTTMQYLGFQKAGPLVVNGGSSYSNFSFLHNQVFGVIGGQGCGGSCESMYWGGGMSGQSIQNITIEFNTFGDSAGCTGVLNVDDASCAGITVSPTSTVVNFVVRYNTFQYLQEGIHFAPVNFVGGQPTPTCNNCDIEYNFFNLIHRISVEMQFGGILSNPTIISNNVNGPPINGYFGTLTYSLPCCVSGATAGSPTALNPGNLTQNNIAYNNTSNATASPIAVEMEGRGTLNTNNMIQGFFCQGFIWGPAYVPPPWYVQNNTIQGSLMATGGIVHPGGSNPGVTCPTSTSVKSSYVAPEAGATTEPTISGNTLGSTPASVASVAPTISPAPGSHTFPLTVTLTDPGYTSGTAPLGNTSIWYTTDGSTPVPGSNGTYIASGGTLILNAATTVKAVGMWGTPPQPTSYPAGYGFTPSSVVSSAFTSASQFFMSPTGNDANPGTSGSPWLTPNHTVACGAVISAASGNYGANLGFGKWGTVTGCGTGNSENVAWVQCATPFACSATGSSTAAVGVTASNWGVSGFVATATGGTAVAFEAFPSGGTTIHHIIFANDICNGAFGGCFTGPPNGAAGVDYLTVIGSIAYNGAQESAACASGIDEWEPVKSDSLSGTHIYFAGNFAWGNINPNPCAGGAPTDGEGLLFDTWDAKGYDQQGAMENNISFRNGNSGMRVDLTTLAHTFIQNNTVVANEQQTATAGSEFGEIFAQEDNNFTATQNITQPTADTVGSFPVYAQALSFFSQTTGQATNTFNNNQGFSSFGHNTACMGTCTGFSFGGGNTTTNPSFASIPTSPGAPNCTGFTTVPACMATITADLAPSAPTDPAWGYQAPSPTSVTDALFPQWMCSGTTLKTNIPSGLVTPGCGGGTPPAAATPVFNPTSQSFTGTLSVSVSDTTPAPTIFCTMDGTTPTIGSPVYTGPFSLTATTTIKCIATASGFTQSAVGSGIYTVGGPPTLTGGFQGNSTNVNTLTIGAPAVQQTAIGTYSDGNNRTLPDGFGNTAVWSSSNGTVLQVTSSGMVSCLTTGTANSQVTSSPVAKPFNPWTWHCNTAPPATSTGVQVIVISENREP